MSNLQCYDVDCTGGIMEKIKALISLPQSEESVQRDKKQKAAGREMWRKRCNHETCDACGEGGNLLCCDRCAAVFHLRCCKPPFGENKVPPEEWACHRCVVTGNVKNKEDGHPRHTLSPAAMALLEDSTVGENSEKSSTDITQVEEKVTPERPGDLSSTSRSTISEAAVRPITGDAKDILEQKSSCAYSKDWRKNAIKILARGQQAAIQEAKEATQTRINPESSFAMLIKAACLQNPSLFELAPNTPAPETSKGNNRLERGMGRPGKRDADGIDSVQARVCSVCGRPNRRGCLINCDFCPQFFHLDCLDLPMTNPPTTRWMCPNHPERALLTHSNGCTLAKSMSSKIKVLDRFNTRFNQHKIKLDFSRKMHRSSRHQDKIVQPEFKTMKVPKSVKDHYKRPLAVPPPPPSKEYLKSLELLAAKPTDFLNETRIPKRDGTGDRLSDTLTTDEELWLKSVIGLQSEAALLLEKSKREIMASGTAPVASSTAKFTKLESKPLNFDSEIGIQNESTKEAENISISFSHTYNICKAVVGSESHSARSITPNLTQPGATRAIVKTLKRRNSDPGYRSPAKILKLPASQNTHILEDRRYNGCNGISAIQTDASDCGVNDEISYPEETKVACEGVIMNGFAVEDSEEKLQELNKERDSISSTHIARKLLPSTLASTSSKIPTPDAMDPLESLDDRLIRVLALQRLQQFDIDLANLSNATTDNENKEIKLDLLKVKRTPNTADKETNKNTEPGNNELQILETKDKPATQNPHSAQPDLESTVTRHAVRAALSAVNSETEEIHRMPFRSCTIGTSTHCDIVIKNQRKCQCMSPVHALIFYDEISEHFELLNTSNYGTYVNGYLHGIDTSAPSNELNNKYHKSHKEHKLQALQSVNHPRAIKCVIKGRRSKGENNNHESVNEEPSICGCKMNRSLQRCGWEGGAVLYHGSVVCFGCNEFVFSVPEYSASQPTVKENLSIVRKLWQRIPAFRKDECVLKSKAELKNQYLSPCKRPHKIVDHTNVVKQIQKAKGAKKYQKLNHTQKDPIKEALERPRRRFPSALSAEHSRFLHSRPPKPKSQSDNKSATKKSRKTFLALVKEEKTGEKFLDRCEEHLNDSDCDVGGSGLPVVQKVSEWQLERWKTDKVGRSNSDCSSLPPTAQRVVPKPGVQQVESMTGDILDPESSPVSIGEVAVSDPDSESPLEDENFPAFSASSAFFGGSLNTSAARQRRRSVMELMCTETLDDFKSPSKETLSSSTQSFPVLIQDITRIHQEHSPLIQPQKVEKRTKAPT